jgi:hypothetical protein
MMQTPSMITPGHGCVWVVVVVVSAVVVVVVDVVVVLEVVEVVVLEVVVLGGLVVVVVVVDVVVVAAVVVVGSGVVDEPPTVDGTHSVKTGPKTWFGRSPTRTRKQSSESGVAAVTVGATSVGTHNCAGSSTRTQRCSPTCSGSGVANVVEGFDG